MVALARCTNGRYRTDQDVWVQRVGYATSVLISAGLRDAMSGESMLDKLVKRTIACQEMAEPRAGRGVPLSQRAIPVPGND